MNQTEIFSIEKDTIEINTIDTMIQFTRYDPYDEDSFLDGLELSDDLTNRFGTILYSRGTKITPHRIARLIELRESNPTLDFYFRINRSTKLIESFHKEIKEQILSLFNRLKRNQAYSDFLSQIGENIESFCDEILTEENITMLLYQMRFICKTSKKYKSLLFQEHPVNVALISLAIASSKIYANVIGKCKTKLLEICKVSLFHNYGALTQIERILKIPEEIRFQKYWEANREGYLSLDELNLNISMKEALNFVGEYYIGRKDFITGNDWPSIMANIVVVADMFLQKESGLFGEPLPSRKVIDQLNVRVAERGLNETAVLALTLGLNLKEIFDFYSELNNLIRECPYNSAVPYPLVGFKSPTIFLCKNDVTKCKHIKTSMKAVTLLQDLGELKKGKYSRCWLLTPKLIAFYKSHYKSIKGIVASKGNGSNNNNK